MSQRFVSDLTVGVLGLSRFTNWYFFAGNAFYDFFTGRHGRAVNSVARQDSYSRFRLALATDHDLNEDFRDALDRQSRGLSLNPLESSLKQELALVRARYQNLLKYANDPDGLQAKLERDRRAEVAASGDAYPGQEHAKLKQVLTLGLRPKRAAAGYDYTARLARTRRIQYNLNLLGEALKGGGPPEVIRAPEQIEKSMQELAELAKTTESDHLKKRCDSVLTAIGAQSQSLRVRDESLRAKVVLGTASPSILEATTGTLSGTGQ